jgi:serine protease Do
VLRILLFVSSFALLGTSSVQAKLPDFTGLVEDVSPSVVKINTISLSEKQSSRQFRGQLPDIFRDLFDYGERPQGPSRKIRSSGSGFVISDDGYILTNHHVVDQAQEIQVLFADRSEYKATVIGTDRRSDLALLKIDGKNFPALTFGDSDAVKVGEWVLAIGSPFGLDYSVTAGVVSAKGRSLPRENYVPFIQTDVAINPGNSGGPLFNLEAEVVGINSQIFSQSGGSIGLSFSIPSAVAISVVEQLKENGSVQRGWLGVAIQDIDKSLAESLQLDRPRGALINSVEPDGPAELGGIEPGDVIIEVEGQPIIHADDLPHLIGMLMPDTKIAVDVIREGKRNRLSIKVGTLEGDDVRLAETKDDGSDRLGMVVQSLNEEQRRALRLSGGMVVKEVVEGGVASRAGIVPGDVVVQLGYSLIDDVDKYDQVVSQLPENTPILIRFYRRGWAVSRTIVIN